MKKSITFNFAMNVLLSASNLLFSLLTFPYLNRVLLAEGMGRVAFAQSVIDYATMLAVLGIPYYGVRACVEVINSPLELAKVIKELQRLATLFSSVVFVGLVGLILLSPQLKSYSLELMILSLTIPLKVVGADYYFRASEQFSYIAMRSMAVRLLGAACLFLFVKDAQDIYWYLLINVVLTSGSNIFNFIYLHRTLDFSSVDALDLKRHFRPMLSFFLVSVGWVLYANTDVIMLGYLTNDYQVGYYNASIRIKTLLIIIFNALIQVVLPRMIQLFQKKNLQEARLFSQFVFSLCLMMVFYVVGYVLLSADKVMLFLAGKHFTSAIPVLRWTILELLPIACSTIFYNILVATSRERHYYWADFAGLLVNILLNLFLIPRFQAIGAGIATVMGGLTVLLLILFYYMPEDWKDYLDWKNSSKQVVVVVGAMLFLSSFQSFVTMNYLLVQLVVTGLIYTSVFAGLALLLKEQTVLFLLSRVRQLLVRKDV